MGDPNGPRRDISVAGAAARVAKGVQARAELRFFTPQQQTTDRFAAISARAESKPGAGLDQTATPAELPLLWCGNADCANKAATHSFIQDGGIDRMIGQGH